MVGWHFGDEVIDNGNFHLPVDSPPSGLDEASCHVGEAHLAKEMKETSGQQPA